jgi:pimeloyl-ACP methyl ester carboxylesterase
MKRTTLQRGDARLSVRDYGGGGRPLVLIHGLGFSQKSWANLVAALGDRYRVITYDQRGHGASTQSSDYSWSSFVGDLEALTSELALANFTLVGHSLGAGVALDVASDTGGCRAVTMIDGAFPVELPLPDTSQLHRIQHNPLFPILRSVARLRNRGPSMSPLDALTVAEEYRVQFADWERALGRLACPAHYLLATEEGPGPNGPPAQAARHATAERAVTLNPFLRVQWIDAGHAMARTRAHEVAKAVMELEPRSSSRS